MWYFALSGYALHSQAMTDCWRRGKDRQERIESLHKANTALVIENAHLKRVIQRHYEQTKKLNDPFPDDARIE